MKKIASSTPEGFVIVLNDKQRGCPYTENFFEWEERHRKEKEIAGRSEMRPGYEHRARDQLAGSDGSAGVRRPGNRFPERRVGGNCRNSSFALNGEALS